MGSDSAKVLAIDDNRDNLTVLKAVVKGAMPEVSVLTALDGTTGIEVALEQDPDVILLDVIMPGIDGFEVCRRLKDDARLRHIPVVFLTALQTSRDSRIRAIEVGAEGFLTKPIEEAELTAQIRAMAKIKLANDRERQQVERLAALVEERTRELSQELLERKRVEEKLRAGEERYRQLIESAHDWVWEIDEHGVYTFASPKVAESLGYEPVDLLGKTPFDLMPPDEARRVAAVFSSIVAERKPFRELAIVNYRKDGHLVFLETSGTPVFDSSGAYRGYRGMDRDISERKQAEGRLREAQVVARLGSYDLDIQTGTWTSSDMMDALFGIDKAYERSVEGWLALVHPDDQVMMAEYFEGEVLGRGRAFDKEYRFVRPNDGAERWAHGFGRLEFDDRGRPVVMLGTIQDITERKQAEETLRERNDQLRQSQKMEAIGQLAGGIAHDFNNLLTAILGYSDLILADKEAQDLPLQEDVQEIKKAAERAAALTRQILAFSRRQTMRPAVVSLNEILSGMEPLLRRTLGEDIDLASLGHPDLGNAETDVHQFEQVLLNLAVNARDAMKGGGRLTLETGNVELDEEYCLSHPEATPGDYVMLAVSDTGIGMDEATLKHIFEPFFTTKPSGEGTGLGLATVYGIVRQSGGSISVYSEPDKGTTFKIYLPRVMAPIDGTSEVPPGSAGFVRGTETVLVVEDEEAIRNLISKVLGDLGYHVLTAGTVAGAWEVVEELDHKLDLLVTDLVLPGGLQGKDLARELSSSAPDLPILYMSGYTRDAIGHSGRLDEGVNFLEKPFTLEALARKVRLLLDQAQVSV